MRAYEFACVYVVDLVATDRSDVRSTDGHKTESAETIYETDGVVFAAPKVDELNRNRTFIENLLDRFLACSASKQHYFVYQ